MFYVSDLLPFRKSYDTTQDAENFSSGVFSEHRASASSNSGSASTVHLRLRPRVQSLGELFRGYWPYLRYVVSEQGFFRRLLRGVCLGRPALDIQLIHATAALAHRRSLLEQMEILSAFTTNGASAASKAKRRVSSDYDMPTLNDTATGSSRKSGMFFVGSGGSAGFATNCFNKGDRSGSDVVDGAMPVPALGSMMSRRPIAAATPVHLSTSSRKTSALPFSGGSSGSSSREESMVSSRIAVVYDLPQDGFRTQTTFWEVLSLARGEGPAGTRNDDNFRDDDGDENEGVRSNTKGNRGKCVRSKVQRRMSAWLLYGVLLTSALCLVLFCGGTVLLVSCLVPTSLKQGAVLFYNGGAVGMSVQQQAVRTVGTAAEPSMRLASLSKNPHSPKNKSAVNDISVLVRHDVSPVTTTASVLTTATAAPNKLNQNNVPTTTTN